MDTSNLPPTPPSDAPGPGAAAPPPGWQPPPGAAYPPGMPPDRPPSNNQGLKIVLGIVIAIVVLCACAGVFSLIVLGILGSQVNNIFSTIASSLGTPTP